MAQIIDNPMGRRMIQLTIDDILMIVRLYQQKCNCKNFSYEEIRTTLASGQFYLPEDL